MASETALFLRQFLANPRAVSSVVPSSVHLARRLARGLGPTSRVVEFGPGTGVVTEALLAAGVAPAKLTLFELNPAFAARLRQRFPDVAIHNRPAQEAPSTVSEGVDCVISGLPLLSFPLPLRHEILTTARDLLAPGGEIRQFSYGLAPALPPADLARIALSVRRTGFVPLNLPPAFVYTYRPL